MIDARYTSFMAEDRTEPVRAVDGRVPGRRGRETRRRLLETAAAMLEVHSYRDITVVDIAREAEVSPGTFYQYFADVETAVLVLADHITDDAGRSLAGFVKCLAPVGSDPQAAPKLAGEFLTVWRRYRAILGVLDLAASDMDQRFLDLRTQLLGPAVDALVDVIEGEQRSGRLSADLVPKAVAASLVSMLAHVAAHQQGLVDWGAERDALVASMAHIVTTALSS